MCFTYLSTVNIVVLQGNLKPELGSKLQVKKSMHNWLPLERHPVADPLKQHYQTTFFSHILTFDNVIKGAQSPQKFYLPPSKTTINFLRYLVPGFFFLLGIILFFF